MYIANGILNNYVYVDLRIGRAERAALFLDGGPIVSGMNENGNSVYADSRQKWSAGRYAFPAPNGTHTLQIIFFDGYGDAITDIPPQPVSLKNSFNCVILDSARRGVWRSEPDEFFGCETHARFVTDGSFINPKDRVSAQNSRPAQENRPGIKDYWREHIKSDCARFEGYEKERQLSCEKLGLNDDTDFDALYRMVTQKHPEAQYMLACRLYDLPEKKKQVYDLLKSAADAGYAPAQYAFSMLRMPENFEESLTLASASAEGGFLPMQEEMVAVLFDEGARLSESNDPEAYKYTASAIYWHDIVKERGGKISAEDEERYQRVAPAVIAEYNGTFAAQDGASAPGPAPRAAAAARPAAPAAPYPAASYPAAPARQPSRRKKTGAVIAIILAVLAVLGAAAFFVIRNFASRRSPVKAHYDEWGAIENTAVSNVEYAE